MSNFSIINVYSETSLKPVSRFFKVSLASSFVTFLLYSFLSGLAYYSLGDTLVSTDSQNLLLLPTFRSFLGIFSHIIVILLVIAAVALKLRPLAELILVWTSRDEANVSMKSRKMHALCVALELIGQAGLSAFLVVKGFNLGDFVRFVAAVGGPAFMFEVPILAFLNMSRDRKSYRGRRKLYFFLLLLAVWLHFILIFTYVF